MRSLPRDSSVTLHRLDRPLARAHGSIVSNFCPHCSTSTLEALPDMSLTPVAPFAVAKIKGHRMIMVKSKFFNTSLRKSIASPASEHVGRIRFFTYEGLTK